MATIIETRKLRSGSVIRIQKRGSGYDVIRNTTGICFHYVEKKVSEQRARSAFELLTIGG
jgi:hypothetical protein